MEPRDIFKLIFGNMFDKEDLSPAKLYIFFKDALSHPANFFVESKHEKYINDIKEALGKHRVIRMHKFVPISVIEEIEDNIDILGFGDQKAIFDSNVRKGYAPITINIHYEDGKVIFINELNGNTVETDME